MGDVVNLRSTPIDLLSDTGRQFVVDCTRAGEGLINDRELAEKYELSPADWQSIKKDTALAHAIRAERESAAYSMAPLHENQRRGILSKCQQFSIGSRKINPQIQDTSSKPQRRYERPQPPAAADRPAGTEMFIIKIDLSAGGGPVETYEKTISIDTPSEGKPDGTE